MVGNSRPGGDSEDDDDEAPIGRAAREFERPGRTIPTGLEFEIDIAPTLAEAQSARGLFADLVASEGFRNCMVAVMELAMAESMSAAADPGMDVAVDVTMLRPSAAPPEDGVSIAMAVDLQIGELRLPMIMEIHSWVRGNVEVTVMVIGDGRDLDPELIVDMIATADRALLAAV